MFVDVNKNAKVVSESRNILLNERDAIAVFTRNLIDSFVLEAELPKTMKWWVLTECHSTHSRSSRRSSRNDKINDVRAVSSVGIVNSLIRDLLLRDSGDTDNFRTALAIETGDPELDPSAVGKDGVTPSEITHEHVSTWQRAVLEKRFSALWQPALVKVLCRLYPAKDLVARLEAKRIELVNRKEVERLNPVPRHAYELLMGTHGDRMQIFYVATECDHRVGPFDPEGCREAIKIIDDDFYKAELEPLRNAPFSRIFFSHVGQRQIVQFVFRTLADNILTGPNSRLELANAWVEDFNTAFARNHHIAGLFDREQPWNSPSILSLGTQHYKQRHIAGLLNASLAFFPQSGMLAALIAESETWESLREYLVLQGCETIRTCLRERLRKQLVHMSEFLAISDQSIRSERIEKELQKRVRAAYKRLQEFI